MADWSKPTTASLYSDFVTEVDARLDDAASLFSATPSNQPVGAIRYLRASNKFQEWDGAVWNDKVIAIAGGGTGAATASGARTNLGLGTIATQGANAVAITGGTLSGITALGLGGNVTVATDDSVALGTNANRFQKAYFRSGLVIPVGTDKFVTS